jgi:cytochrome c-type biogenesis protein
MADASVLTAFLAGIISFLSPCVLPLVPGYISIVSGFSLDQLKADDKRQSMLGTVVLNSLMFVIGFSITFILLGASATFIGQLLVTKKVLLGQIAGVLLIVFGLHLTGIYRINFLYQDKRFHGASKPRGMFGALVLGLAFAFGWSPCIGPMLATVLGLASAKETLGQGVFLLAIYSAGLGIPFLLTSLGLNQFLGFYAKFKRHFQTMEVVSGVLVIAVGLLFLFNRLTMLNNWFSFLNRFQNYM